MLDDQWKPFSLTYVAYKQDDAFSFLLAVAGLSPLVIVVVICTLVLSRRDLHTISVLALQACNELLNFALKRWFAQDRPKSVLPAAHFGRFGFPSQHAQFMGFFAAYFTLFVFVRLKLSATVVTSALKLLLAASLWTLTALVAYGRVSLGHHTWSQVLWGLLIGCILGIVAFAIVQLVLTPLFPRVVAWKVCEWLMIRDSTPIPNIIFYEYMCTRSEARNRARRQHNSWNNAKMH